MITRDDMIAKYQDRYLEWCRQVSELRWEVRRWRSLAWMLGAISGILLGILIWG